MRSNNIYMISDSIYGFTQTCIHCGEKTEHVVTANEYERLFINNEFVKDVFPHLDHEEREVLISGTHPKCWKEMFEVLEYHESDDIDFSQFTDEELGFDNE